MQYNPIVKQLLQRKSIRQFTGESVTAADLDIIFRAALRAPTSINGQQISIVYTQDKDTIAKIAQIAKGQPQVAAADVFVTFVIDFNRTAIAIESLGKQQQIEQSAEGIIVGAVDAGIMLTALQAAAESLGYGTTAIGGIRANPQAMIELLELPAKTYPVVGTTIGVPTQAAKEAPLKPRMPMQSVVMKDKYDTQQVKSGVYQYEQEIKAFRTAHQMNYLNSYMEQVAGFYAQVHYRDIAKSFEDQGFKFQDGI